MKLYLLIYRAIITIFFPLIFAYLIFRIFKKKEQLNRIGERFGFANSKAKLFKLQSPIIWIHAVSVGEANSAFLVASELLKFSPKYKIILTTTTLTSAQIIAQKIANYPNKIIHQFMPIDVGFCVKKFLNFWQPRAIIFIESEIWPNVIATSKSMAIPSFLLNARISNKSLKNWQKIKKLGFNIFDYFSIIFAQSSEEQKKLNMICANEVLFYGNLKAQAQSLNVDKDELQNLENQIKDRPIWLCASTHNGEEEIILNIHRQLRQDFRDLLTIIVPRHPARINEITTLLNQEKIAIRSKKKNIIDTTEIYIADTLNELGIFYQLANFAFIGGSLLPIGGHNPFEAIKLNCAVITGSQVENFAEIYQELLQENAIIMVKNPDELYEKIHHFLSDKKTAESYAIKAKTIIDKNNSCVDDIIKKIDQIILINV